MSFIDEPEDGWSQIKDLYADPRIRPERPHYAWLKNQCRFFHEHHRVDRWNLNDPLDSFQLYYTIDILGFRAFELALLLHRDQQYKKAHYYFGVYDAMRRTVNTVFPYRTCDSFGLETWYQRIQREITEMEEKREARRK